MKKLFFFFLTLITHSSVHSATNVEAMVGYYRFTDSKMNKVYNHGGLDFRITETLPLWNFVDLYGCLEIFEKGGKSLHGHQKSTLWGLPLSIGIQPSFTFGCYHKLYFTIGPRYYLIEVHNHSHNVTKNMHSHGIGGFVNVGARYALKDCVTFDLFCEYSRSSKLHFHDSKRRTFSQSVQVGGVAIGGGVGYNF